MISLESYPKHSEDLVCRVIDGEAVILTTDGRNIHTLNPVGSAIWELSDGTKSIHEIISLICKRFAVSSKEAKADVLEFEAQLLEKNLLEIK